LDFTVPDLRGRRELWEALESELPDRSLVSRIHPRASEAQGQADHSNRCAHCSRPISEWQEIDAYGPS
jgi:hypothetical protein